MKGKVQIEISPKDTMYEGNRDHYLAVGQSALHCTKAAMFAANKSTVRNILDFACGFGRVMRVLKTAFPMAELTASDISSEAINFCAKEFGATPVLSSENVAEIPFKTSFDLIWCGSLMTHFDVPQFQVVLRFLQSLLSTDGLLVFTTHGPFVAQKLRTTGGNYGLDAGSISTLIQGYDTRGFGYVDYPGEILPQVGVSKYGFCVSKPSWVCGQIESIPNLRLVTYTERAWDNHQDSVACMKS
jgi:SAM-dependent methyltransferase